MTEIVLSFDDDGRMSAIYSDELLPVLQALGGEVRIQRASHVEPAAGGGWDADMTPSGGPESLGGFKTRQEALDAEIAWLRVHVL